MGEHGCDTSTSLAQTLLHTISANNKISIFTGDVVEGTTVIFSYVSDAHEPCHKASVWLANRKSENFMLNAYQMR